MLRMTHTLFSFNLFLILFFISISIDIQADEILPIKREYTLSSNPQQIAEALAYSEISDSLFTFQLHSDNKIREYDAQSGALIHEFSINFNVTGFAGLTVHPTRNTLIAVFDQDNYVGGRGAYLKEFVPDNGMEIRSIYLPEPGDASGIVVHPITGNYLVMDSNSNGGGQGGDLIHEYSQTGERIGTWLDLEQIQSEQDHGGMDYDPITGHIVIMRNKQDFIEIDLDGYVVNFLGSVKQELEWVNGLAFSQRNHEIYVSWGGEHEPNRGNPKIVVYGHDPVTVYPGLDFAEGFDFPDDVTIRIIKGTYANLEHGDVQIIEANPGDSNEETGYMLRFENKTNQGSTVLIYNNNVPLPANLPLEDIYPVLVQSQVWTDDPNVQIAIGCVDTTVDGMVNNDAIGLNRIQNNNMSVGQWKTVSALHQSQTGYFVPFVQAVGNGGLSQVYFDDIAVYVLNPNRVDLDDIVKRMRQ